MPIKIKSWPEGHPHLTTIDNYPFGYPKPENPNPLLKVDSDGYAASFRKFYKSYTARVKKRENEFNLTEQVFYLLTSQPDQDSQSEKIKESLVSESRAWVRPRYS
jgi:hypothetical protein